MRNTTAISAVTRTLSALWAPALAVLLVLALPAAGGETPVKPSRGHAMVGKELFQSYCSSCHGATGQGDGPIAAYLVVPPQNLTQLTEDDGTFPFEEVMAQIDGRTRVRAHGSQDMPIWGKVFKNARTGADEDDVREQLTSITHYLWSIQAKPVS